MIKTTSVMKAGAMLVNTTTPDGASVGEDGAKL